MERDLVRQPAPAPAAPAPAFRAEDPAVASDEASLRGQVVAPPPTAPSPPSSPAAKPAAPKRKALPVVIGLGIAAAAIALIALRPDVAPVPTPAVQAQHQVVVQPQVHQQVATQQAPTIQQAPQTPVVQTDIPPVAGAVKDAVAGAPAMWGVWIAPATADTVERVIGSDGVSVTSHRVSRPGTKILAYITPGVQGQAVGLIPGDVVLAYNGQPTPEPNAFNAVHAGNSAGAPSTLTVVRNGTVLNLAGPVGAQPFQGHLSGDTP